jgi:putative oxidoreductase
MSMSDTSSPRPYVPALAGIYSPLAPYGLAFIRIVIGLFIARHGYPKLFEGGVTGLGIGFMPKLGLEPGMAWAYLVAYTEFAGGIFLAAGFLTRFVALALTIEFAVIVFVVKWANGFFGFNPKAIQPGFAGMIPGGFEFELSWGLICLAFVFMGGGRLSIDRAIGREL